MMAAKKLPGLRFGQCRIVHVTLLLARIERRLVRGIESGMSGIPVGQIRIGKKRHPEGDEIGATRAMAALPEFSS